MKKLTKLIALAALLVLCLSLTACGSTKLDLSEYLDVTFSGMDGNGTARMSLDFAQMELDYAGVKDGYPTQKQLEKMVSLALFESSVKCEADKEANLKNGDKITVTITYGKERAKEAKVKVGSVKKTFTVEGLQEPILIDPFDEKYFGEGKDVDLQFSGIDPELSLHIENNANSDNIISEVHYNMDGYVVKYDIKNGDEITIHAGLDYWNVDKGYVLTRDEITITVSGKDA